MDKKKPGNRLSSKDYSRLVRFTAVVGMLGIGSGLVGMYILGRDLLACRQQIQQRDITEPVKYEHSVELESCVQDEDEIRWTFREIYAGNTYRDSLTVYVDKGKDGTLDRVHLSHGMGKNHYSKETYPEMGTGWGIPAYYEGFFRDNCIKK
jgi:hypothetical protein